MNTKKTAASTAPPTARIATSIEKMPFASFVFPSPRVLAMRALPPVPNRKPTQPRIIRYGMMKFTAVNAALPAKFETKKPSVTQ